jgi:hypothetical protein
MWNTDFLNNDEPVQINNLGRYFDPHPLNEEINDRIDAIVDILIVALKEGYDIEFTNNGERIVYSAAENDMVNIETYMLDETRDEE